MLQRVWLDRQAATNATEPARAGRRLTGRPAVRIGIVSPVLVRGARRGAEPHPRPGRDADRARPRRQRARAGRRGRAAPAVRGAGRPCGAGAVQRLGGAAGVRAAVRGAGAALARATATSTCVHVHEPITPSLSLLAVLSSDAPGGRDVPHREHPVARAWPPRRASCSRCWRRSPGASRSANWPARCRWSTWAAARWEIPNGVAVAAFAAAEPLPGWPGDGRRARLPRPVHRAAQGLPDAARGVLPAGRRPARACGCWSPGRATPTRRCGTSRPASAERIVFLGLVSEEDKRRMLRSVDVYVAPNTGGESFGMILTEAMAAGTPVVGQRPRRVPARARRRAARCSRSATPTRWPPCSATCSTTRDARRRAGRARPQGGGRVRLAGGGPAGARGLRHRDRGNPPLARRRLH